VISRWSIGRVLVLLVLITAIVWIAIALIAVEQGAKPGPRLSLPALASLPTSASSHVVVIVMENKEYDQILGSSKAPFANRLAGRYAIASRYYGIRHPSLPNYLALTGGETFGINSDCIDCHVNATNLVDQLERGGLSWKGYMEDMPTPCYRRKGTAGYAKKHNPFIYYDDIANNPSRCAKLVPYQQLAGDLTAGSLPSFVWISPNLCDDTHDCSVSSGDRFLASIVPALLHELGPHGRLYITWDEGVSDAGCCKKAHGGRVLTIIAGPGIPPGTRLATPNDHYSLLRSIEDQLHLTHLGNAACTCTASLAGPAA
jgi:hypothetical protein